MTYKVPPSGRVLRSPREPKKDECDNCGAIGFAAKESSDVDDPHDYSVAVVIAGVG
jgi:hypothetical protein